MIFHKLFMSKASVKTVCVCVCMYVPYIFIKCINAVCTVDGQTCSQDDLDVSFTVCDCSTELAYSQSARNITSPISAPCTLSCYGFCSSTRRIYFPFLCHTWQTILSSPIWPGGPPAGKCLGCGNILAAELAAGVTAPLQEHCKHARNALPLSGLLKMKSR